MILPAAVLCEMHAVLPATLRATDEFIAEFQKRSLRLLDQPGRFAAELLVREALTNAVVHGSRTDPARQVCCTLRIKGCRLLVAVEDSGDGFDWRTAWNHAAAVPQCSGRGIEILRKYADRVRYNGRGNLVTIVKRFGNGERK